MSESGVLWPYVFGLFSTSFEDVVCYQAQVAFLLLLFLVKLSRDISLTRDCHVIDTGSEWRQFNAMIFQLNALLSSMSILFYLLKENWK